MGSSPTRNKTMERATGNLAMLTLASRVRSNPNVGTQALYEAIGEREAQQVAEQRGGLVRARGKVGEEMRELAAQLARFRAPLVEAAQRDTARGVVERELIDRAVRERNLLGRDFAIDRREL